MSSRSALSVIVLTLIPAFTLAQDGGAAPGQECQQTPPCPEAQIFDEETETCIVPSSQAFQAPLTPLS